MKKKHRFFLLHFFFRAGEIKNIRENKGDNKNKIREKRSEQSKKGRRNEWQII